VLCKLENVQFTGSFKIRGATNKIAQLSKAEREQGVVTASTGNHGTAVAATLARLGGRCIVFAPATAPRVKIAAMQAYGAEVKQQGEDSGECEHVALNYAKSSGLTYVSPYDDPAVIAGQGTIGAELERQTAQADIVVVSVGGGGLISGIAGYLKARRPQTWIVGASPANDHSMMLSAKAGRAVVQSDVRETLSDGTAGTVQPGAITIPLCGALVDEWPLVSEDDIVKALQSYVTNENQLIEGAAAVAIAALINLAETRPDAVRGKIAVVVLCGARIDFAKLVKILG
jgi:threonine dehydratase